ncbi:hypothetical protein ABZ615_11250 [Streptomyces sp. NPDC007325]|uniref:hypothetical protein n=1 Tax=Streptomyces sp. NPDC007325 TaxID=3154588 RepID=UPI0033E490F3
MSDLCLAENPVQSYSPEVFDGLPLFRDSKEALRTNRARLCPLGGVILHHGFGRSMAISLLHKHFPMAENEFLLRSFDMQARTVTMRPVKEGMDRSIPYLWRAVRESKGRFSYYPLEYVRAEDAPELVGFDLADHQDFLSDMAQVLVEHDLLDLFGVAHPNITKLRESEDELLVETTDSKNRVLTVRPEPGPPPAGDELTETLWTFSPVHQDSEQGEGEEDAVLGCTGTHCAGHCHGHCLGHCVGHCHSHHPV